MTSSPFEPVCTRGRVLLVEAASVFREMQSLLLQRAGYGVVVCDQTEAALIEASKQPFDVAVLTSDAKGVERPEFLAGLRQHKPSIGLIFVTKSVTMELTRELMGRGVTAVLQRPVNPTLLMQSIDEAMGLTIQPGAPRMHSMPSESAPTAPTTTPFGGYRPNSNTDSFAPFPPGSTAPFPSPSSTPPFRAESASPFVVRTYTSGYSAAPFRSASASPFGAYGTR